MGALNRQQLIVSIEFMYAKKYIHFIEHGFEIHYIHHLIGMANRFIRCA